MVTATFAWTLLLASPANAAPYFAPALSRTSVTCSANARELKFPVLSQFEVEWYSGTLTAAKEPSLYSASLDSAHPSILRFTWLRSFHPPVVIRVEWNGLSGRLVAKQLSGAGGYVQGKHVRVVQRRLGIWETFRLRYMLWRTNLLKLPPKDCVLGLDGAEWVFEAVDEDGYHYLDRWSPESGGVRDAGLFLVGLTGWTFNEVY